MRSTRGPGSEIGRPLAFALAVLVLVLVGGCSSSGSVARKDCSAGPDCVNGQVVGSASQSIKSSSSVRLQPLPGSPVQTVLIPLFQQVFGGSYEQCDAEGSRAARELEGQEYSVSRLVSQKVIPAQTKVENYECYAQSRSQLADIWELPVTVHLTTADVSKAVAADQKVEDDATDTIYPPYVIAGSNYLFEIGDEQGDYQPTACGALNYLHGNGYSLARIYYHGKPFTGC